MAVGENKKQNSRNDTKDASGLCRDIDVFMEYMTQTNTVLIALDAEQIVEELSAANKDLDLNESILGKPLKNLTLHSVDTALDHDISAVINSGQPINKALFISGKSYTRTILPRNSNRKSVLLTYVSDKNNAFLARRASEEKTIGVLLSLSLEELSLEHHLHRIVDILIENIPSLNLIPKAGIFLAIENDSAEVLRLSATYNLSEQHQKLCNEIPAGRCLCGKVFSLKQNMFGKADDVKETPYQECMGDNGHYCLQLKQGTKVIGILNLQTTASHTDSTQDQSFLGRVADVVAATVLRRVTANQLMEAKVDAERANNAKSEFLSNMSHELRTPLNVILGFGQLLKLENARENRNTESLELILNAGKHLLELINDILDLAKIDAGTMSVSIKNVGVEKLINHCIQLVKPLAKDSNVSIKFNAQNYWVKADSIRLTQVLLNLIINAVKYNKPNGSVTIDCTAKAHTVEIRVQDNGIGIREEQKARLFEPFQRLEPKKVSGTGIGLNITQRLTELMGGDIGFTSQYGVGSTFWIELPHGTPVLNNVSEPDVHYTIPVSKEAEVSILYIEDDADNVVLMQHIFKKNPGYGLSVARSAADGLAQAEKLKPDLIILDINLPDKNGFEVLKLIKRSQNTRNIPVVALTSDAIPSHIMAGYEAGFAEYITKPVKISLLLEKISNVLTKLESTVKSPGFGA